MNLVYETNSTLYHHGVKGMRWGRRKAKYITAYQAQKNATKAAEEARKKSIAESRASGDKGIGSFARANRKALNAKRKAYGESINKDKAYNKELRADKKVSKGKTLVKGVVLGMAAKTIGSIGYSASVRQGNVLLGKTLGAIGTVSMVSIVGSSVYEVTKN